MPPNHVAVPLVPLITLAAIAIGCADVTHRIAAISGRSVSSAATESDLHAALTVWASTFASLVSTASDRIRAESREREVRRNTLLWQLRVIPLARRAVFRPDVQEAYVASLAVASAQVAYLTGGDGRALFGAQQAIAVEAANQLEENVIEIGRVFLSQRQLARLQIQVDELVARYPIHATFAADELVGGFSDPETRRSFAWVLDLPMTPFRALAGVSDTAAAVNDFSETARDFTEVVSELPHLVRWELELLLYDAEELATIDRALTAAESFADVARDLSSSTGAPLAERLAEARAAIAEVDAALARAENLGPPLTHVADRLADAVANLVALNEELRSEPEESPGRPFDVREYESAAIRIGEASRELRDLVAEMNRLDASVGRSLVDQATWRAAVLIGLFFTALAGYRWLASRLR